MAGDIDSDSMENLIQMRKRNHPTHAGRNFPEFPILHLWSELGNDP